MSKPRCGSVRASLALCVVALLSLIHNASAEPINGFSVAPDASCHLAWDGVTGRVFFVQSTTNLCTGWGKEYGVHGTTNMGYTRPSSLYDAMFFCITSREERVSEFETDILMDFQSITVSNISYSNCVAYLLAEFPTNEWEYVLAHLQDFGLGTNGLDIAVFSGAPSGGQTGQPALPYTMLGVLLPPNANLVVRAAVFVEDAAEEVPGEWDVLPMPPAMSGTNILWPPGVEIVGGRDVAAYSTNASLPASALGWFRTGQGREWKKGDASISPYRYNPVTKHLSRILRGRLVVTYDRLYGMAKMSSADPAVAARYRQSAHDTTVNFDDVVGEYDNYDPW